MLDERERGIPRGCGIPVDRSREDRERCVPETLSGTKDLAEPHKSRRILAAGAKSAENRAQGSRGESGKERVDDGCEPWF